MTESDAAPTRVAAVRGAITVPANTAAAVAEATARLLTALAATNRLDPDRIVSALFTATPDLDADFPAHAARKLGWSEVPLLCAREIDVPGALPRVVRVLLTVCGVKAGERLTPVYLDGATALRPDLGSSGRRGPALEARGDGDPSAAPRAGAAPSGESSVRRVAILGLGQIGGSLGLALGRVGRWWRAGFDPDPAVRERALQGGAIDVAADSIEAACGGADLAVAAASLEALPEVIEAAAAALTPGATLVDTGSARAGISAALERAATRGVRAVGGHPLAGSQGHGLAAARADLFEGARFVLLPLAAGVPAILEDLIRDLGARPLVMASEADHDRALARTSHLLYLVACALERLGEESAGRGLSGPAHRDMTRLAASDPHMAMAYCRANAREVAAAWSELRDALEERVAALEAEGA